MTYKNLGAPMRAATTVLLGALSALAAVLIFNASGMAGQDKNGGESTAPPTLEKPSDPLIDGQLPSRISRGPGIPCESARAITSRDQIQSETKFWLAERTFDSAWTCVPGGPPVVMYDDVQVGFEPGAEGVDVEKHIRSLIEVQGGSTADVQGRLSWVGQGDAKRGTFTYVWFVVEDTIVHVLAQADVPLDRALEVARELSLPPST